MKNIKQDNREIKNTWYKVDTTCGGYELVGCGSSMINGEYTCGGCGKTRYEYMGKKLVKNKIISL